MSAIAPRVEYFRGNSDEFKAWVHIRALEQKEFIAFLKERGEIKIFRNRLNGMLSETFAGDVNSDMALIIIELVRQINPTNILIHEDAAPTIAKYLHFVSPDVPQVVDGRPFRKRKKNILRLIDILVWIAFWPWILMWMLLKLIYKLVRKVIRAF